MIGLLTACATQILKQDEPPAFTGTPIDTDTATPDDTDTGSCTEPTCDGIVVGDRETDSAGYCVSFSEIESHGLLSDGMILSITAHDVDGDGNEDVFIAADDGASGIYLSNGDGTFDYAPDLFSTPLTGEGRRGIFADYDSDGIDDFLYLQASGSVLYYGNGVGFTQVPDGSGFSVSAGRDAVWLGLGFLVATENGTRFYEYGGEDSFTLATSTWGLTDPGSNAALAVADFSSDGHDDVFSANTTGQNRLFLYNGATYTPVEETYAVEDSGACPATDALWLDFNNDGFESLIVSNYGCANEFYEYDGAVFTESAAVYGLQDPGATTSLAASDLAHDRLPWINMTRFENQNLLYKPILDDDGIVTRYEDVSDEVGAAINADGMESVFLDLDGNGEDDLVVATYNSDAYVYRNDSFEFDFCE